MSTNFYLITDNKQQVEKWFKNEYNLTDEPYWGYEIHIAKTSMGWLPLFEAHKNIKSIKQLKECCNFNNSDFEIIDEYGNFYNWQEFEERVLKHNGGVDGAVEKHPRMIDYDDGLPKYVPISHFQLNDDMYFKDEEGYEFLEGEFV